MSYNQTRSDRNGGRLRGPARSGGGTAHHRGSSVAAWKVANGGVKSGTAPVPAHSPVVSPDTYNLQPSVTTSARNSGNGQCVRPQEQGGPASGRSQVSTHAHAPDVENGHHPNSYGVSGDPAPNIIASGPASKTSSSNPLPKPPSQPSPPEIPENGKVEKVFSLQFGSISPGLMKGLKIPARKKSDPANLDEPTREQANGYSQPQTSIQTSLCSVPNQQQQQHQQQHQQQYNHTQLSRQEDTVSSQLKIGQAHPLTPSKEESDKPVSPNAVLNQSFAIPIPGESLPLFQDFHAPMPLGGANFQMQSQNIATIPFPFQMLPLMVGAQHVQPHVLFPAIHPHTLQSRGIMHQTHTLNSASQIHHQLPPQIGTLGMGVNMQYTQQQAGTVSGQHMASVKIIDPNIQEDWKRDKRNDLSTYMLMQNSLVNMPHHYQPKPVFTPIHQATYYQEMHPSIFTHSQMTVPTSALHLPHIHETTSSQPLRLNFSFGQSVAPVSIANAVVSISKNEPAGIPGPINLRHPHDGHSLPISAPLSSVRVTTEPPGNNPFSHGKGVTMTSSSAMPICKDNDNKTVKQPEVNDPSQSISRSEASDERSYSTIMFERHLVSPYSDVPLQMTTSSVSAETPATGALIRDNPNDLTKKFGLTKHSHERMGSKDIEHSQKQIQDAADVPKLHATGLPLELSISDAFHEIGSSRNQYMMVSGVTPVASANDFYSVTGEGTYSDVMSGDSKVTQIGASDHIMSISNEIIPVKVPSLQKAVEPKQAQTKEMSVGEGMTEGLVKTTSYELVNADDKLMIPKVDAAEASVAASRKDVIPAGGPALDSACSVIITSSDLLAHDSKPLPSSTSEQRAETLLLQSVISDGRKHFFLNGNKSAGVTYQPESLGDTGCSDASSTLVSGVTEKSVEVILPKPGVGKRKKKKKMLLKADTAGMNSDLYMAYKGSNEKQETNITMIAEQATYNDHKGQDITCSEDAKKCAVEFNWEDVVEVSSPKMPESLTEYETNKKLSDNEANSVTRYSKDFLLMFPGQCTHLPAGFEIGSDIANLLMNALVGSFHVLGYDQYSSSARINNRPNSASRVNRHSGNTQDDSKQKKVPSASGHICYLRSDIDHGYLGVRSQGVLRNPRGQSNHCSGGILSGPLQSSGLSGGPSKSMEADRWTRGTCSQRGIIPPPNRSVVMHKADKKYELGKVSDEELKQRQLKAILNKLTPQNFDKLFEQVKEVNIDTVITLTGVISQIFDKAIMEPTFCEMYANFCVHLAGALPDFTEENKRITFRSLLLNKCQEEFERGEREQAEAEKIEEDGEVKQTVEEREEKKVKARRRMLGNIRFIGELYKKKMLTERIMHECIQKLLGQGQDPNEEDIEALCKLMSTIGEVLDQPKAKEHMDGYFKLMETLSLDQNSRLKYMLLDVIDLRKSRWQQRRKIEGPKKIEEVHWDAAQERQAQASRSCRGHAISSSRRRCPPVDYGPRVPTVSSSSGTASQQIASIRGLDVQAVRMEGRHLFESRIPSVPLPERPSNGSHGGLARRMPLREQNPTSGEVHKAILGSNISSLRESIYSDHRSEISSSVASIATGASRASARH